MRLRDKICLITGSTGIAAATARLAATEGARLFLTSRTEEHCRTLAEELNAGYYAADLTAPGAAGEVVGRCVERYGRVDALYNVAGISGRSFGDGPIHECTEEGWDITLDTNAKSQFLMCRAAIGHMLHQEPSPGGSRGVILNMASVLAFAPESRYFATHAYAASKGAIIAMSKAMASYYAPRAIRVNVIAPALVRTPMSRRAQANTELLAFMHTKQPLSKDLIEPDEVARASVFLLSDDASAITGHVLTVDAGWCVSGL
jgi:NAD(P)-dependent dehydrogenase (short-subunit alcohol dehydrogenase family)